MGSRYETSAQLDWGIQVVEPLKAMLAGIMGFIPLLLQAIGILVIGWAVASVVRILVKKFLQAIHFDQLAEHTGISEVINEKKVGMTPSLWISKLIYWFGIMISWIMALDVVRLQLPSVMFQEIGQLFSRIFIGFFIFLVGLFLSVIVSKFIETSAKNMGIAKPGFQAGIIRWAMIFLTFMITLSHFGFPIDFLIIVLSAVGGTLCLTFVIAVGFGGIQCVPKMFDKWLK